MERAVRPGAASAPTRVSQKLYQYPEEVLLLEDES